ncbi:hypothetical protein [Vallitalea maricola]|uniref:Uncharacterized protein n=1 Tax=Vallitalea maricola TaxID=3074433 RepID=A0ACB5UP77_9FIRM|nr:hypothetical protein AN2V17_36690 [Vallitalea sp. AN17-2]
MKKILIIVGIIIVVAIGGYKICQTNEAKLTVETDDTLINDLLKNNWSEEGLNSLLGDYEQIIYRPTDLVAGGPVMYYQTYSNGGLKVQFTNNEDDNHVYSLIFNSEFKDKIIGEIDMNSSSEDITSILDSPHFVNEDIGLIGYKLERFYIFFIGKENIKEISIYPRTDYDKTIINKAIEAYNKTKVPSDFINVLWKDYDYISGESSLTVYNYDNRGIIVELEDTGTDDNNYVKLKIYGNYIGDIIDDVSLPDNISDIQNMKNELFNQGIEILLDEDSIYNCELERLEDDNKLKDKFDLCGERSPNGDIFLLNLFSMYTGNRIRLYDENQENLLIELLGVDNYGWINDRYFIYCQPYGCDINEDNVNSGIYIFDCINEQQIEVVNMSSTLKSWDNNTIIYAENGEKQIEHKIKYTLDKSGNISLENGN